MESQIKEERGEGKIQHKENKIKISKQLLTKLQLNNIIAACHYAEKDLREVVKDNKK